MTVLNHDKISEKIGQWKGYFRSISDLAKEFGGGECFGEYNRIKGNYKRI